MVIFERTADGRRKPLNLREPMPKSPAAGGITPEERAAIAGARPIKQPEKRAINPAGVAKRKAELAAIMPYAKEFLDAANHQNVIPFEEFQKYIPLFKKEALDQMSDEEKSTLAYEYAQRINPQQPVRVIDLATPENRGATYKGTKYKVLFALPAWTNRLDSVNKQGQAAMRLAAELLAGTRASSNPFDTRQQQYSAALTDLLAKGNADTVKKQEEERAKMTRELQGKLLKRPPMTPPPPKQQPTQPVTTSAEEPSSLDAEWEE